ncbi:MAG: hypothetical protein IT428_19980 [Planctomycetaceae bacterium]|nr:hypothetical protein [Planctomycetaceae bacterium]
MSARIPLLATLALGAALLGAAKAPYEISAAKGLPEGPSKEVAALLQSEGHQVSGPKGVYCTVWLAKSVDVKPTFKPSLNLKYPLTNGQLIGLLQVADKAEFTDFRKQPIKPGVYTLRYAKQPEDGNHIGTSEVYDFLVAIPAKDDADPKMIGTFTTLAKMSAKASGTSHPAIISLLPVEKPAAKAALEHDEEKDFWILNATTGGKADKTDVPMSLRLVVVGASEG